MVRDGALTFLCSDFEEEVGLGRSDGGVQACLKTGELLEFFPGKVMACPDCTGVFLGDGELPVFPRKTPVQRSQGRVPFWDWEIPEEG